MVDCALLDVVYCGLCNVYPKAEIRDLNLNLQSFPKLRLKILSSPDSIALKLMKFLTNFKSY